jgi:hypothetical protein
MARRTLDDHLGTWTGTWSTWLEPDALYDVSPIELEVQAEEVGWRIEYRGNIAGDASIGTMRYRFDDSGSRIDWRDSWHTGNAEEHLVGMGNDPAFYSYLGGDQLWGWLIDIDPRPNRLLITHSNIPPVSKPVRAVSMRLRR